MTPLARPHLATPGFLVLAALLPAACDGGLPATPPVSPPSPDAAATHVPDSSTRETRSADAGAPSTRVTLTNMTARGPADLTWAAFRDGDGAWRALEGTDGVYELDVQSGRFSLAFVCDSPLGTSGELIHATTTELPAVTANCDLDLPPANTEWLAGAITLPAGAMKVEVAIAGPSGPFFAAPTTMNGQLSYKVNLPPGSYDLSALARDAAGRPLRALFRRGVDVPLSGDSTVDLDLVANGAPVVQSPLTIVPAAGPGEQHVVDVTTVTARGATIALSRSGPDIKGGYDALAEAALVPDEAQEMTVVAIGANAASARGVVRGFRAPAAASVTLPAPFASAKTSAAARAPYLRPRLTFDAYEGALFYQLAVGSLVPLGGEDRAHWLAIFSKAWLGPATAYDFPDLSAVPGWKPEWGPDPKTPTLLEAFAVSSTRTFAQTIEADRATAAGAELRYAKAITSLAPM